MAAQPKANINFADQFKKQEFNNISFHDLKKGHVYRVKETKHIKSKYET